MPDNKLSAKYPTDLQSWQALQTHYRHEIKSKSLLDLFRQDQQRFSGYSLEAGDLFLDYSKNFLDRETRVLLVNLAHEAGVPGAIERMFTGDAINVTEDRPARQEVLVAAATKWNFLPFRPGLVGGHCIGVDPYYLTYKAQQLGYNPEMILAGRRINDNMSLYVASRIIKLMLGKGQQPQKSRVLMMGLTFKENCPDVRNTKVVDIVQELVTYGTSVDVFDPWVDAAEARREYDIEMTEDPQPGAYDVVVLAVAHEQFRAMGEQGIKAYGKPESVFFDIKYLLPPDAADGRL